MAVTAKYCSKCPRLIEESRKGQRYCKTCHAEYMRTRRSLMFSLNKIRHAFNQETMNRNDFLNRLYE